MPLDVLHFTPGGWSIAALGALAIGLSKGGLTGLGIVPVLLFALILPARESTGFVLPLLIVGDIGATAAYWRVVDWRLLRRLLPPTLAGVVLGYFCMAHLSNAAFRPLIGAVLLGLIVLQLVRERNRVGENLDRFFASRRFGLAMGGLTGLTTMIANAAGPVANLYFLSLRLPKWNLIGTTAWLFFITNLWKVPFSVHLGLINRASLALGLLLTPVVVLGLWAGRRAAGHIPQRQFERFVLFCSALGAFRLLFS